MEATIINDLHCIKVPGWDEFGELQTVEHMITMEDVARLSAELGQVLIDLSLVNEKTADYKHMPVLKLNRI